MSGPTQLFRSPSIYQQLDPLIAPSVPPPEGISSTDSHQVPNYDQHGIIQHLRNRSLQQETPEHCGNDMAAGFQRLSGDARRQPSSSFTRSENRPPMSNILCRNGPQCRKFAEGQIIKLAASSVHRSCLAGTCSYNHDFSGISANGLNVFVSGLQILAERR